MSWQTSGLISVANGSKKVYGVGTVWVSSGKGRSGDGIIMPNGLLMEVASYESNTECTLVENYLGATANSQAYKILPLGLLPSELADMLTSTHEDYRVMILQLLDWETSTADTVPITNPATGVITNVKTLTKILASLTDGSVDAVLKTLTTSGAVSSDTLSVGTTSTAAKVVVNSGGATKNNVAAIFSHGGYSSSDGASTEIVLGSLSDASGQVVNTGARIKSVENYSSGYGVGITLQYRTAGNVLTDGIVLSQAGSTGFGVSPGVWSGVVSKALELQNGSAIAAQSNALNLHLLRNAYFDNGWKYKSAAPAARFALNDDAGAGGFAWFYAEPGAPGDTINWTQLKELDASGNEILGANSGPGSRLHVVGANTSTQVFDVVTYNGSYAFYSAAGNATSSSGESFSSSMLGVRKDSTTSRSINAAGTINASGADYAEYERKAAAYLAVQFLKGDIVGFNADGELTPKFSESIRFGVKSTNPNIVGGDTWGSEDKVGKRPEPPSYTAPVYEGAPNPGDKPSEPALVLPPEPQRQEGEADDTLAVRVAQWREYYGALSAAFDEAMAAYAEVLAKWEEAFAAWQSDDAKYQGKVIAAQAAYDAAVAQYEADLPVFEAKLEAARQLVDRIAYAGKVPCNVIGANPGDYIIAAAGDDGMIVGVAVSEIESFSQMKRCVGVVNRILEDGRAEIAVRVA
ncbi:hypothetical protein [Propionivibrio dicarboxylicus]|uniref:Uncharacterized protein n=1 Tax=Propionivibrio dicarboxylicus TaxID=83767 RepID=A0A1G8LEV9_9RHOO|nr:hypothetical protein [Propionivibrio dicarboxylicus]SDI54252.1 hypothetical protein SAMN05660652_03620 [Propionivibrio dicarboxylicus]